MSFNEEEIPRFLELFESYKSQISSSPGCNGVRLIQEKECLGKISTLSYWASEQDLENYRNSPLFEEIWPTTKAMFKDRPTAVSYTILSDL